MRKNNLPYRTIFLEEFAKSSWEHLQHIGYPNSNDEEWRFSNPNPWILSNKFNKIKKNNFPIEHDVNESIDNYLTIRICDNNISIPKRLPDGIEIFDMFQGMEKNILDGAIGSVSDYHNTAFSAENMALFNNGILIYVHKNFTLEKPLQIIHEISNNENMQLYPRIYLNMGINSNVEIYETQISNDNKQYYINSVIEVVMHENSNLNWTLLQNLNCNIGHLSSFDLGLEKNAELKYNFYDFGGGFIRRDINVNFYEPGASLDLNGLFVLSKKQHIDIFSKINHKFSECSSNQLVKGVLFDSSSGVFRGLAHVENKAKKTNANQANHNLLLSPNAKINSIPILEIHEDDVKCTHGSTTGQIDGEAIFYLQTRGINRNDAIRLIVRGFIDEIVNKIKNDNFKNYVKKILIEKMNGVIS